MKLKQNFLKNKQSDNSVKRMNFAALHRMTPQFPEMFKWLCRMSVVSWVFCCNYERPECDPIAIALTPKFLNRNTNLLCHLQIPYFQVGVALETCISRS
jgi:hypothetical protein